MRGKGSVKPKSGDAQKVMALVTRLNQYRYEYYNLSAPSVSDAVYDRLYDELQKLEKKTGIIYSNSPTQTVGYVPISALEKVKHSVPLLSFDKTKKTDELQQMLRKAAALLMLKLDGLTIKGGERMWTDGCMERIREIVHVELASQNAVFAGQLEKIEAGIPGNIKNTGQPPEEETLPEYSDDFPEGLPEKYF